MTSIYKNLINSIRNFCLCNGSFQRSILINFSWTLPILIPNFQRIIFYQWTTLGNPHFEDYLHPFYTRLTRLSSLKPQEVSGHEPLIKRPLWQMKQGGWLGKCRSWPRDQGVREPEASHATCLTNYLHKGVLWNKQYLPTRPRKAIGLRIINMCVNFLAFQCYFLCPTPLGKYRILILKKLSWMSTWFGDSTKLLKTNL